MAGFVKRAARRALILSLALCVLSCGAAFAESEDPVCVRVGDFCYSQSLAQQSLDSALKLQEAFSGEEMTGEEKAQMASDVIDNLVGVGLIESKLTEAGQHDFTEEEVEQMNAAARSRYEELWKGVYQMMVDNGMEATEEQVMETMDEEGYTLDALYREFEVSERQRRAIDLYVPPILLTEDDLTEYYEGQFLEPDRERYSADLPLSEREVLAANNESFYTPEGYRYFRQILLEYPEEAIESLKPYYKKCETAAKKVAEAYAEVAEAAVAVKDWSELDAPRAKYDAAAAALEAANQEYVRQREAVTLPLIQDTLDAIDERLDAGIDFKSLISKYSADVSEQNVTGTGYPLHPDSEGWPKEFIEAGMAMEKPGDVSKPVLTEKGIHILYYDSDVPAGDHVLTDDERELLKESAIYYYQVQELTKQIEAWKQDYDIETHPEMLKY